MGLDVSHDCWHGAYSAFSRWRNAVAEAAGYEIAEVKFRDGGALNFARDTYLLDYGHLADKNYQGDWDEPPTDPLMVLLAHSDCDGWIHAEHAGPLADRLTELLPLLPEGDGGGHIGNWHEKTQRFIDGLRLAAEHGEDVKFA